MSNADLPGGLDEQPPEWHFQRFLEFTDYKQRVGEPSPHLAMVGHMTQGKTLSETAWMLGCYGAVYCLPTAQVIASCCPADYVEQYPEDFQAWLTGHWKGIVTRQERRCIRTPAKLTRCLVGWAQWVREGFPTLQVPHEGDEDPHRYYDRVWKSVNSVPFIGRYIGIRIIEGLRRFAQVPAQLYDIRSIGGWSPKKALVYFYPDYADLLLSDSKEGNAFTDQVAEGMLTEVQKYLPEVNHYVFAAMLCEYREAFEDRHQYPGWTIDQEPLLHDKVKAYWGDLLNSEEFWGARAALFPREALGEFSGWNGTRWDLTKTLRDHGYVWTDTAYHYASTKMHEIWEKPITWDEVT